MDLLGVIIPAAGQSVRFGSGRNKLLEALGGRAVVAWAIEAFLRRADVGQMVIVTPDPAPILASLGQAWASGEIDGRLRFAPGGPNRAQSVHNGLAALRPELEWVAVHDAARPLVSQDLIDRTFQAARAHGAAVPALPVHLTIKQACGPLPARVQRTLPRQQLWAMQTPQIMRRAALEQAFAACPLPLEQITDDAQLIELAGGEVWLVEGEERNLKLTTALDLASAESLLTPNAQPGRSD